MKVIFKVAYIFAALGSLNYTTFANASDLQAGLYEIVVKVELPNLTVPSHVFKKRVCITNKELSEKSFFGILSDNPLSNCGYKPLSSTPREVKFQIVCPGKRSAYAYGTFTMHFKKFSGSIKMNMGGKNMTLIERQDGKYIGPCKK